jgi:hypothetical protein
LLISGQLAKPFPFLTLFAVHRLKPRMVTSSSLQR